MFTILICTDHAGAAQTRLDNRAAHLAHLEADAYVVQAGPLMNAAGEMAGSLIVFATDDRAHVEAFAAADPYAKAGLFAEVRVETWNRVMER